MSAGDRIAWCWTPLTKTARVPRVSAYSTFWYGDQVTSTGPVNEGSLVSRVSCFATRKTMTAPGKSGSQGIFDPVAKGTMRTTAKSPIQTAAGTVSQLNTRIVTMPTHEPTMSSEYATRGGKTAKSFAARCE